MCGIFYVYKGDQSDKTLEAEGMKIRHRGPDNTTIKKLNDHYFMFHRLCINDLSEKGNQPFSIDDCVLICNGEIYNSGLLNKSYGFDVNSGSDCETIIHAYRRFGIQWTVDNLDGVFAFVLYDKLNDKTYIARDRVGVRALYYGKKGDGIYVSSEMKSLHNLCDTITPFLPGTYGIIHNGVLECNMYHTYDYPETPIEMNEVDLMAMIR